MSSKASSSVAGSEMVPKSIGRVIFVTFGKKVKRIGIDGSAEAIVDAIKATFGLRTKRPFWLFDENWIIIPIDRNMPLGNYTLHLDRGISVEICPHVYPCLIECRAKRVKFYNQDDFSGFLIRNGWIGLGTCEFYDVVDSIAYLDEGDLYHGVRLKNA